MEFTVKRSTWIRGQGVHGSLLLRDDGKQCCLGFLASACGIEDTLMLGISVPEVLPESSIHKFVSSYFQDLDHSVSRSHVGDLILQTNDAEKINDEIREKELTMLFKALGVTIKFVD